MKQYLKPPILSPTVVSSINRLIFALLAFNVVHYMLIEFLDIQKLYNSWLINDICNTLILNNIQYMQKQS